MQELPLQADCDIAPVVARGLKGNEPYQEEVFVSGFTFLVVFFLIWSLIGNNLD